MDRRTFIQAALTNLGALALGSRISSAGLGAQTKSEQAIGSSRVGALPTDDGALREFTLVAAPAKIEIPSRGVFEKWLYNGQFPGPEIRAKEGERLRLTVKNGLPEGTTIHWHGIPLQNSMDGVPDITQPAIPPGGSFLYEFDAAPSGSYLYHSHFGLQPDRGLVGPLVVEEKKSHVAYDREYTLALDDFLAGAPAPLGRAMNAGGGMAGMLAPPYVMHLINGRPPEAPAVFEIKNGERVRLRLVNLAGATIYRLAIAGHAMMVTHTDGRPVESLQVDALRIAPGERYDVVVQARNPGVWPIAASPDNDLPPARAILRYTDSNESRPREGALPEGLSGGKLLQLEDLRGLDVPETRKPNRTFHLVLAGGTLKPGAMLGAAGKMGPAGTMGPEGMMGSAGMMVQEWTINGQAYPQADPLEVHQGETVRIRLENQSAMPHPMHLHGHFFRVGNVSKDTAVVWTHSRPVEMDIVANNPGKWLFHCHNLYHMEGGMMRLFRYV